MTYRDAYNLPEDVRIDLIGKTAIQQKKLVGFVTDSDPGKADRYISKLLERFPGLEVVSRGSGPVPGAVYVTVQAKGKV